MLVNKNCKAAIFLKEAGIEPVFEQLRRTAEKYAQSAPCEKEGREILRFTDGSELEFIEAFGVVRVCKNQEDNHNAK